ncbi:MAG: choice-of-anchor L domain-containing protein [Dermatophilaceae bacterium]
MIRNATLALAMLTGVLTQAQLSITDSLNTSQIANLLEGLNVAVSNVTTSCDARAVGEFGGVSEIPFTQGIILSTGAVDDAAGINMNTGTSTAFSLAWRCGPGFPGRGAHNGCVRDRVRLRAVRRHPAVQLRVRQ